MNIIKNQKGGNIGSIIDTGHLVLSAITPVIISAFIGFGSIAKGKIFLIYSILTIAVMLAFGFWTSTYISQVSGNMSTPGMGLIERVAVFSPMIWMLFFAIILLRSINKKK
ncbi:MAG: hypothetical protein JW822_08220 [Spirochaetales bacterium]|nr:hypothetical protein [Spirochaetales bacterium]